MPRGDGMKVDSQEGLLASGLEEGDQAAAGT